MSVHFSLALHPSITCALYPAKVVGQDNIAACVLLTGPLGSLPIPLKADLPQVERRSLVFVNAVDQSAVRVGMSLVQTGSSQGIFLEGNGFKAIPLPGNSPLQRGLKLELGTSDALVLPPSDQVTYTLGTPTTPVIHGLSPLSVHQHAATLRQQRLPDPYKGKGVRYRPKKS